jgi:predicted amidophosphoribosyltransferase
MPCDARRLGDGTLLIACSRGRRSKRLLCDGCDAELSPKDAVSPRTNLDFCPKCAYPAFAHWLEHEGGRAVYAGGQPHELKRNAFRFWARANAVKFLELVKRSAESLEQVPDQLQLGGAP